MPEPVNAFSPPPPPQGPFAAPDWTAPQAPPPGAGPLPGFYPITIGRGVSLAWHLFRFGWRTFVSISLIAYIPIVIATAWAESFTFDAIYKWQQTLVGNPFGTAPDPHAVLAAFPASAFTAVLLVALIVGPFSTIGAAALIDAISSGMRGERLSARRSYGAALARLKSLLVLYVILTAGAIAISAVSFIFPALGVLPSALGISGGPIALLALVLVVALAFGFIFVMIRIAFALQALMIEGLSTVDALRRSWSLIAGSMLRLIGWMLVFALLVGLLGLVFELAGVIVALIVSPPQLGAISSFTSSLNTSFSVTFAVIGSVFTVLGSAVFQPLLMIGATLLYFEIRWRRGESVPTPGQPTADPAAAA